jgi:hypothetical protein
VSMISLRLQAAVILTLMAAGPLAAAQDGNLRVMAPVREQYVESKKIVLAEGQTRIDLGVSFIIAGSDSITLDGLPLRRETDYRINILKGTLILVRSPAGGELLSVRWKRYPFSFAPVFASRFPGERPQGQVTMPDLSPVKQESESEVNPYKLRLSGNKTVGFSMGSGKDLGIDQSLKVTMMGKLAKDLEVKAYLTDDNLPVQPQGNTEELKHLDKVAVQVKSRHTETNFGDFISGQDWSSFSRFQRELRGASVKVNAWNQELFAGGGITKGRFQRAKFFGIEGVQGPYELLDARRFNGVIILPGSESVFLDGRRMKRGAENNYVIDYGRGTITFTERITITADSEIVVDYQSGEDGYGRTTLTGGWTSPLAGGAATLRGFYFRESDDPDDPVRGVMTDEDKEILAEAGDDPLQAIAPGVTPVDNALDTYILVPADTIPEHFQFVEEGGDFAVDFYDAGDGNGDYVTEGFTRRGEVIYKYTGPGTGNYLVGDPLPLPERKEVISLGFDAARGSLFLSAEGNLSLFDANILSGLDNDDNEGGALRFSGGVKDQALGSSKLSLLAEYSSLEERFRAPDETRDAYFYRNWNLNDVPLTGTEKIAGLNLAWEGEKLWKLGGSYNRLQRTGGPGARKTDASLVLGDMADRGLEAAGYDSKNDLGRDRRYLHAEGAFGFWEILPKAVFDTERYRSFNSDAPDTGRYYYQNLFSISKRKEGRFRGTLSYMNRTTDLMEAEGGEWNKSRENDEIRIDAGFVSGEAIVEVVGSRRNTEYADTGGSAVHDLGRLRYRDAWWAGSVTNDLSYRISSGVDRKLEKAVVYVGENQGDYDEEGNEVGQNRGDYMVIFLPAEDAVPVRTVELSWRLSIGSGVRGLSLMPSLDTGTWEWIRRNVSVDNFFSVVERSSSDELARLYLLDPSFLQQDQWTLYGKNSIRSEWGFLGDVKGYNLRFVLFREDEEDNRSEDVSVERYTREIQGRFELIPRKSFTLTFQGETSLSSRMVTGAAGQMYRVESLEGSVILAWRLRPSVKLAIEGGAEERKDEVSAAEQVSIFGTPSVDASIGEKIHLNALLRLTWTDEKSSEGKPLFFLEEGLRQDWNIVGQYRFTKFISFGINYNGHREKDYNGEVRTVHAFKLESRAYF